MKLQHWDPVIYILTNTGLDSSEEQSLTIIGMLVSPCEWTSLFALSFPFQKKVLALSLCISIWTWTWDAKEKQFLWKTDIGEFPFLSILKYFYHIFRNTGPDSLDNFSCFAGASLINISFLRDRISVVETHSNILVEIRFEDSGKKRSLPRWVIPGQQNFQYVWNKWGDLWIMIGFLTEGWGHCSPVFHNIFKLS